MNPEKGAHRAIAVAIEAGVPLKIAGKCREPAEELYFRESSSPTSATARSTTSRGDPRGEGRAAAERPARPVPVEWEEPFGLVMIESMACGTPVIATRWGAVDPR